MTSVLDDPTASLYAGALLGKALSTRIGANVRSGTSQERTRREATLQAGVASGKIDPSSLSKQDSALLGAALHNNGIHVPGQGILSDVGGFFKNLAHGAGEFGESLGNIPSGLYGLGKAGVEEAEKTVRGDRPGEPNAPFMEKLGAIGKGIIHDFSSPKQIYEHPFNPLIDVATVASAGGGAVAKLGAAGKLGEGALGRAAIKLGSPQGREAGLLSPGFTKEDAANASAAFPRYYATQRPFTKYVIQKPFDWTTRRAQKIPKVGDKLAEFEAKHNLRKLTGVNRGQETAGTGEEFVAHAKPVIEHLSEMYKGRLPDAQREFEATMLHSVGINNLEKLDEYGNRIVHGEDVDGIIMTPDMQNMANYRAKELYNEPQFRELMEKPTQRMKNLAYEIRKMNAETARKLDLPPQVIEDAAFGRLRQLWDAGTPDVLERMPKSMRPYNTFAKGLYALQQHLRGEASAEDVMTPQQIAMHLPYGTKAQKLDIVERAVKSLQMDLTNEGGSALARAQMPGYVSGNNLFEKVANAIHAETGTPIEEAAAFARGVALGTPDGPILPTYIPSLTGQEFKFGKRGIGAKARLAQAAGVGKFRQLDQEEPLPGYIDWDRPFAPRQLSAQMLGKGPMQGYLKDAEYGSWLKGAHRIDPETIIRNAYKINKDIVQNKLKPDLLRKVSLVNHKTPDGMWSGPAEALEALGVQSKSYQFMPVDVTRDFFNEEHDLMIKLGEGIKEGLDEQTLNELAMQSAQKMVEGAKEHLVTGNVKGVLVPQAFFKELVEHARLSEQLTGPARILGEPVALWKTAVLAYSPAWFFRTAIGHGILALVDGTIAPKYWNAAKQLAGTDRPILPEELRGLSKWKGVGSDRIYTPEPIPYGVNQGGMQQELADIQGGEKHIGELYVPKKISQGVHVTNNFQRRAVFYRQLDKEAKQRWAEVKNDLENPLSFWNGKDLDAIMDPNFVHEILKYPDLVQHAFDQLSHVSYTFGQMNPWERKLVRYVMPFYGWYKFVSKFVASMPLNYPGRANALAALGHLGVEEHDKLGALPDWLSGALFFNTADMAHAKYVNLYGLNPFNDVANPFGEKGPLEGTVTLGHLSPLIQSVVSAMGINPLNAGPQGIDPASGIETTRFGQLIDTKTGKPITVAQHSPLQRFLGTFLRTFPEIRSGELAATGGNPVFPESIPFLDEHPIPVNPQTRRGTTWWGVLGKELGVEPRETDLGKYQAKLLKTIIEAKKKNPRTVAKERLKLSK